MTFDVQIPILVYSVYTIYNYRATLRTHLIQIIRLHALLWCTFDAIL